MTQFYQTADEPPPLAAGLGYDGLTDQGKPLIATDADTSVIAAHLADYANDALIGVEPSAYHAPAYFIGLKKGWLFEGPFDTRPLIVDAPPRTIKPYSEHMDIDVDFLKSLVETLPNENQDRQSDH